MVYICLDGIVAAAAVDVVVHHQLLQLALMDHHRCWYY